MHSGGAGRAAVCALKASPVHFLDAPAGPV